MSVRAKFTVNEIRTGYYNSGAGALKTYTTVRLQPVYDSTIPEDLRFAKATPSGEMTLQVDNPAALEYLEPGKTFYVDFTRAD